MKIAFDSQIFTMQKYGGISRYVCSLATHLVKSEGIEAKIFAPFYINVYLGKLAKRVVSGIKIPKIPKTGRFFHSCGLWLARRSIAKFAPQIVHETYYAKCHLPIKGARTVVTVYDMIHERFPSIFSEHDRTSQLKRESVLRADHVICISENTRRDLLDFVPVSPDKVSVVHLGFDQVFVLDNMDSSISITNKIPFLLFVGGRGHYKNFDGFLKAYGESEWLRENFRIVCIGGGKLRVDELDLMNKFAIDSSQVEQFTADDTLLAEYYRSAAAFIYPSKYEGFGIPPLEAMSLKCPVICSNSSSIPEVVGDAGEYFDPNNTDSMRVAIERVLKSKEYRQILVQKGIKRCASFSWEKCASETLAIYRKII